MAEVLIPTPVDEITRLPLQVAPKNTEWLPRRNPAVADEHHGIHPKEAAELHVPVLGPALRNLQLRVLERQLHNDGELRYHHRFGGPALPQNYEEGFSLCVPGVAGFISRQVIDMEALLDNANYVRDATPREWEFLRTPGGIESVPFDYRYVYHNLEPIRDFFIFYLVNQGLHKLMEDEVAQFMSADEPEDRALLAGMLLLGAAEEAVDPGLASVYRQAYSNEQLHPDAPSTPVGLISTIVSIDHVSPRTVSKLDERLRQPMPDAA